MIQKPTTDPFELFAKFTELRKGGVNRDEAWLKVCETMGPLHEVTQNAFLGLAKNWERQEGHKYQFRGNAADDTMTRKQIEQVQTEAQRQELERAKAAQNVVTGTLDPGRLRQHNLQNLEKVLDQAAIPSAPIKGAPGGTTPIGVLRQPDFFGPSTLLLMHFIGYPQPLVVTLKGEDELTIGRLTPNSAIAPEIDLEVVNAGEYGVSRMHAAITRRNDKLLITDLGSMNHTRVNGVRLLPNEIRTLEDGNEIWFGYLRCHIRFQQK